EAASSAQRQALATNTPAEGEYRLRSADGSYCWHRVSIIPIGDSAGRMCCCIAATDVHNRKLFADELRDKEDRLRIALEASDTGTFRWNPRTGEFLEFGPSLKRLFGMSDNEIIRCTEDFVRRVHPDDVPAVTAAVERSRAGGEFDMEYRVVLPDGKIRWLYDRGKMVEDSTGHKTIVGAC